jgi:hypothetical protein
MWPVLFGSGWVWGLLVTAALVCFIAGVLGFLFLVIVKPPCQGADDIGEAWHRYEEGDLTLPEWKRKVRRFSKRQVS